MLTEAKHPEKFGVAEFNEKGEVVRLIEKPKKPPSNFALVGVYFFKPIIFDAVKHIKPSWRNELEITDAIQGLIDSGRAVNGLVLEKWWKDTGKPQDLLETNRSVLDELFDGQENRVLIGKDCKISESSLIEGPVIIGDNCEIIDSKIRPYTCIQKKNKVLNSTIENSILMENSAAKNMYLHNSVIGSDCLIESSKKENKKHTFYIGDRSQIDIVEE